MPIARVPERDGRWLDTHRSLTQQSTHEHWAAGGRRIYAHGWLHTSHSINRIDRERGRNPWFVSPLDTGSSIHLHVSPDQAFLGGDGHNFDRRTMGGATRRRLEAMVASRKDFGASWFRGYLDLTNGGETIWKYELPQESIWDPAVHANDQDRFYRDLRQNPDREVRVTPVCRFRTLCRGPMLGYRLKSNAHVTPDNRWVIFQSSGDEGRFEVWAASVRPEREPRARSR